MQKISCCAAAYLAKPAAVVVVSKRFSVSNKSKTEVGIDLPGFCHDSKNMTSLFPCLPVPYKPTMIMMIMLMLT